MGQLFLQIRTPLGNSTVPLPATSEHPLTIGRHSTCDIVLQDTQASRRHCQLMISPAGWRLRDLGSSNGTTVNGHRVSEAVLNSGDVIQIGETEITYLDASQKMKAGASALVPDDAELLTEADLVESPPDDIPAPSGFQVDPGDTEQVLEHLADMLLNKKFSENEIALLNARDRIARPRGEPRPSGPREPIELFRLLLLVCFRSRATDIHLEPKSNDWHLRVRMDGTLIDLSRPSQPLGQRLSALIKVLAEIDPSKRDLVQEGHFAASVPDASVATPDGRRVDYRVSFVPSMFGQKLVIRILDTANAPATLETLGLPPAIYRVVRQTLDQHSGMLLVCGPTGSGKTTSLYALVRSLDLRERNIVTIEDPIETQLDGVTQLPVDEEHGRTFSGLLRSTLRQDPDAIMVGEIRDTETARIALQAAITGHLVFSSVHTKDTTGTIFRLLDLGIEPYMVSQGLHVVLSQRLCRKLCTACKRAVRPTPQQLQRMGPAAADLTDIYLPLGCPRCLNTGYMGRQAFFEVLTVGDALREAILKAPTPQEIQRAAESGGLIRLQDSGFELVARGITSFDEIDRGIIRDARLAAN